MDDFLNELGDDDEPAAKSTPASKLKVVSPSLKAAPPKFGSSKPSAKTAPRDVTRIAEEETRGDIAACRRGSSQHKARLSLLLACSNSHCSVHSRSLFPLRLPPKLSPRVFAGETKSRKPLSKKRASSSAPRQERLMMRCGADIVVNRSNGRCSSCHVAPRLFFSFLLTVLLLTAVLLLTLLSSLRPFIGLHEPYAAHARGRDPAC